MQFNVPCLLLGHGTSFDGTDHDKEEGDTVLPPFKQPKKLLFAGLLKKSKKNGNDQDNETIFHDSGYYFNAY